MDKEPETYEELIRTKRCIELVKYYELDKEELDKIYYFLTENKEGKVICNMDDISLVVGNNTDGVIKIKSRRVLSSIQGLVMSNTMFRIIPTIEPATYYGYGTSNHWSSGGTSSNNNNNNNNNNNR